MPEELATQGLVLVVDDLLDNTLILKRFIRPLGFEVDVAQSGEEALKKIADRAPDIILLDLVMPGMSGFEVCEALKAKDVTRHIPIIIVTGLSDPEANVRAVSAGADDFLVKPFDRVLLEARIRSSFKTKRLHDALLAHQDVLEQRVRERTQQVVLTREVTVFALARLAESRDTETGDHLERMRRYARILAADLCERQGRKDDEADRFIEEIYSSSPLHDIGKVGIPDRILLKQGSLSDHEFGIMKSHTVIGGDTLRDADYEAGQHSFLSMGRDIAYYHHERWDGHGYPNGLKGTDIPLAARIVSIADVYDALTSKRCYKEAFTHERSRDIVMDGVGKQFDPEVIDSFRRCESHFVKVHAQYQESQQAPLLQQLSDALEHQDQFEGDMSGLVQSAQPNGSSPRRPT